MNNFIREKCLSCRYAREIMRSYRTVIREINENTVENLQDHQKECLDKLAAFLELGDLPEAEKFRQIKDIFSKTKDDNYELYEKVEHEICIVYITSLIYEMNAFFTQDDIFEYKVLTSSIFKKMCDSFKINSEHECKAKLAKKYADKLKKLSDKIDSGYAADEQLKLASIASRDRITKREYMTVKRMYLNIFDAFIEDEPAVWGVKEQYDCIMKDIMNHHDITVAADKKYEKFLSYYNTLEQDNKDIVDRFILRLPTHFGNNLSHVMNTKGMTETTIVHLIKPFHTEAIVSDIQSLKKQPNIVDDERFIRLLCRVLLVDRDVLYTGTGKSFGNWMPYLNGGKNIGDGWSKAKETILPTQTSQDNKKSPKITFRNELAAILEKDVPLVDFIKKYEYLNIFYEEDFSVFKEKYDDGFEDEYEDEKEHYNYILDKNAVYALLEALSPEM